MATSVEGTKPVAPCCFTRSASSNRAQTRIARPQSKWCSPMAGACAWRQALTPPISHEYWRFSKGQGHADAAGIRADLRGGRAD